jgi:hypothetical protein
MTAKHRVKYFVGLSALLLTLASSCGAAVTGRDAGPGLRSEIRREAQPFSVELTSWEIQNMLQPPSDDGGHATYGLAAQIHSVLKEQQIVAVPPVQVRITKPPLLLVVSPRSKIQYFDRILLRPDLTESQIGMLEAHLDGMNVSSLVAELGGFGAAYPAIVSPDMPIRQVVLAATEEWTHQYLALRPLGFLYLLDSLGIGQDPEVIAMNETLAGMVSEEIGSKVYDDYYRRTDDARPGHSVTSGFDFDKEMRETRTNVDRLLENGNVDGAERYMEARRTLFVNHGYKLRKLNQAYFAFHGIYGQDPGSVSPVYAEMSKLRGSYSSLSAFLEAASAMTRHSDLLKAVSTVPG